MTGDPFRAPSYILNSCRLRPVEADEADALGVGLAAIDPWKTLGFPAKAMARNVVTGGPETARYGIETDGCLVGAVSIKPAWLRGPYLEMLGILPDGQGRGLGNEVLSWMEAEGRRAGARNLWTAVSAFNSNARRFYETFGFRQAASLDDLVLEGFDENLMRKKL